MIYSESASIFLYCFKIKIVKVLLILLIHLLLKYETLDSLIPPQNSILPNINRANSQSFVRASEPCFNDFKFNRKTRKDADEANDQIDYKEGDYIFFFCRIQQSIAYNLYQFTSIKIIQN